MENLIIQGTKTAPEVAFFSDGNLKIEGKIITENAPIVFSPIFEWLNNFHPEKVVFDIAIEYMNTSASMHLYRVINHLDGDIGIKEFNVNWYYDEDDEEHLEIGEIFQDKLNRAKFKFIKVDDEESNAA